MVVLTIYTDYRKTTTSSVIMENGFEEDKDANDK